MNRLFVDLACFVDAVVCYRLSFVVVIWCYMECWLLPTPWVALLLSFFSSLYFCDVYQNSLSISRSLSRLSHTHTQIDTYRESSWHWRSSEIFPLMSRELAMPSQPNKQQSRQSPIYTAHMVCTTKCVRHILNSKQWANHNPKIGDAY